MQKTKKQNTELSASTSSENLATPTSSTAGRLSRIPSLPRTYNRNKSGIPVAAVQRELPQPPHRG